MVKNYLFVESRCDEESPDVAAALGLAGQLCDAGHEVTVLLIQNAVAMAGHSPLVADLTRRRVRVWVDDFSFSVRGFDHAWRSSDVRAVGVSDLVTLLMTPGVVPVWH